MAFECAIGFLSKKGFSDVRIKGFLKTKPLILRYFISCFWHNMEWVSKGGIDSRPAARITNDLIDQDYVITQPTGVDCASDVIPLLMLESTLR